MFINHNDFFCKENVETQLKAIAMDGMNSMRTMNGMSATVKRTSKPKNAMTGMMNGMTGMIGMKTSKPVTGMRSRRGKTPLKRTNTKSNAHTHTDAKFTGTKLKYIH